jgi:hypothetical protein
MGLTGMVEACKERDLAWHAVALAKARVCRGGDVGSCLALKAQYQL